ncbi:hypothetical protein VNO78_06980 [Psophocarpus tetragonolobus]|uniref:Uncharacterized protein n=1 Tax=Psophocarpus tetragonolobus TaxID=3891 RepID=A0AAN9SSM1_PSOTE
MGMVLPRLSFAWAPKMKCSPNFCNCLVRFSSSVGKSLLVSSTREDFEEATTPGEATSNLFWRGMSHFLLFLTGWCRSCCHALVSISVVFGVGIGVHLGHLCSVKTAAQGPSHLLLSVHVIELEVGHYCCMMKDTILAPFWSATWRILTQFVQPHCSESMADVDALSCPYAYCCSYVQVAELLISHKDRRTINFISEVTLDYNILLFQRNWHALQILIDANTSFLIYCM